MAGGQGRVDGPLRARRHAFQFALADAFTLCDAYHCSIQGGTNSNRLFLFTGTNGPTGADGGAGVNEWDSFEAPTNGYRGRPIRSDWPRRG